MLEADDNCHELSWTAGKFESIMEVDETRPRLAHADRHLESRFPHLRWALSMTFRG